MEQGAFEPGRRCEVLVLRVLGIPEDSLHAAVPVADEERAATCRVPCELRECAAELEIREPNLVCDRIPYIGLRGLEDLDEIVLEVRDPQGTAWHDQVIADSVFCM
jgi:hypothetical protein